MTDEELRKLALEYHRLTDGGTCRLMATPVNHAGQLAHRLLELLPPADDGEAVTADWIMKVLPPAGSPAPGCLTSAVYETPIARLSWVRHEHSLSVCLGTSTVHWWNGMTRSQFRRLCAAIGITLQEPPQ